MKRLTTVIGALLALASLAVAQDTIGDVPYERQATRAETLKHMLHVLAPSAGEWEDWHLLSPFPYEGHELGLLAKPLPPEDELAKMAAGGPGPDFAKRYVGKNGLDVAWLPQGDLTNKKVDLHVFDDPELNDYAICYLYARVVADEDRTVALTMGTDDGVRLWFNGELVHDNDAARGMNPFDDALTLDLKQGVNHALFKITEAVGGWEFQINTRDPLDAATDAQLYYFLDRDFPPSPEREHYRVLTYPNPPGEELAVGGLAFLSDGTPVVTTRRGDVWLMDGAYAEPPIDVRFHRFASGLHEALGAAVRTDGDEEAIYTVQRGELTRLLDTDGDRVADRYETVCDDWGVSGNYHEFAFGPKFDAEGNAWVTLNVGFCGSLGKSTVPYRGWALKIAPDGTMTPVCDGLRSPNGIAAWTDGEMFYVDNQGDYVATNRLSHLKQGSWHGHPSTLRWRDDLASPDQRPPRQPASVWFPYKKMGQSAADIALDTTGGAFGPFAGQFFVGDQTLASVMRVDLELVDGHYQGACFPFLEGLSCGVNRVAFAPDGSMIVGQTDRGWASIGRRRNGLERIVHTGVTPFEILRMRATETGFRLEFTGDVDPATAGDPASYAMSSYTYEYHPEYGAPEDDTLSLDVTAARVTGPRTVELDVANLREEYVHELHADGVRDADGRELLHAEAYYTLIHVPGRDHVRVAKRPRVLFLTHSAGFVHEVVKRPAEDELSIAEQALVDAAAGRFDVTATQDCEALAPDRLAEYDAVVFYTSGELPVPDEWRANLFEWVKDGGAFVGVHSATDTWYESSTYHAMVGGTFDGHPWHQEVRVDVVGGDHPATRHLGDGFAIADEIYQFKNHHAHPDRPLLALDMTSVDASKSHRPDFPHDLAWCKEWGAGRVFYTALGHGAEVWADERFLDHLLGGIDWAVSGEEYVPPAPEGAVVLFDGTDTSAWSHGDGSEVQWTNDGTALEVAGNGGNIVTRESFGDAWIHVEFRPPPTGAEGQDRGNSGVYVQGRYEVQVLDSFGVDPAKNTCGAIYDVKAPDFDVTRPAGNWQTYDILFRAPRFDADGAKTENARITIWLNGIQIHRDVELPRATAGGVSAEEAATGPILLQDHANPVRFRNLWVVPL